ncbi:MAG: hypothetical protein KKE11_05700, partial [Gammaproteobacteria bacterium]|nr:hypothetical protein [Gammaproteobacteria bacterium]
MITKNSCRKIISILFGLIVSACSQSGYANIIKQSYTDDRVNREYIQITLKDTVVTPDVAEEIANILSDQKQSVGSLQFTRLDFLPGTFSKIMQAVQSNPTLRQLQLESNVYSDNEMEQQLIETIHSTSELYSFTLNGYSEGSAEFWRNLTDVFSMMPVLADLSLVRDGIGNTESEILAELLRINSSLCMINLSENKIDDESILTIFQALKDNNTLTEIILNGNLITNIGWQTAFETLADNATISNINIEASNSWPAEVLDLKSLIVQRNLLINQLSNGGRVRAKIIPNKFNDVSIAEGETIELKEEDQELVQKIRVLQDSIEDFLPLRSKAMVILVQLDHTIAPLTMTEEDKEALAFIGSEATNTVVENYSAKNTQEVNVDDDKTSQSMPPSLGKTNVIDDSLVQNSYSKDTASIDAYQVSFSNKLKSLVSVPTKLLDTIATGLFNTLMPITGAEAAAYCHCLNDCYRYTGGWNFCCINSANIAHFSHFSKTNEYQNCPDGFDFEHAIEGSCGTFSTNYIYVLTRSDSEGYNPHISKICYGRQRIREPDINVFEDIFVNTNFQDPPEEVQIVLEKKIDQKLKEVAEQKREAFIKDFFSKDPKSLGEFIGNNLDNLKEFAENIIRDDFPNKLKESAVQLLDVVDTGTSSINPKFATEVVVGGLTGGALNYAVCELMFVGAGFLFAGPPGAVGGLAYGQPYCGVVGAVGAASGATKACLDNQYLMDGGKTTESGKTQGSTDRKVNPSKAESKVWKDLKPHKKDVKTNGLSGKKQKYYKWDY